jgi:hypothetical protein
MKPLDRTHDSVPPTADSALRSAMRVALAQSGSNGLEDLQNRVLAQWEMRGVPAVTVGTGSGGTAWWGLTRRDFQLCAATLIVLVALGWQVLRMQTDVPMDDLLEPDVLSLMAMGEL